MSTNTGRQFCFCSSLIDSLIGVIERDSVFFCFPSSANFRFLSDFLGPTILGHSFQVLLFKFIFTASSWVQYIWCLTRLTSLDSRLSRRQLRMPIGLLILLPLVNCENLGFLRTIKFLRTRPSRCGFPMPLPWGSLLGFVATHEIKRRPRPLSLLIIKNRNVHVISLD